MANEKEEKSSGQLVGTSSPLPPGSSEMPPLAGRRAFRALNRELTESDLAHPGNLKLLLEMLEQSYIECDRLRDFEQQYHDADKRAGILEEKIKANTAIDIFYGAGLAIGGIMIGLSPSVWDNAHPFASYIFPGIGSLLILISITVKLLKK